MVPSLAVAVTVTLIGEAASAAALGEPESAVSGESVDPGARRIRVENVNVSSGSMKPPEIPTALIATFSVPP